MEDERSLLQGRDVNHLIMDQREEPVLHACVNSSWWGSDVRFSRDLRETWEEAENTVRFAEGGSAPWSGSGVRSPAPPMNPVFSTPVLLPPRSFSLATAVETGRNSNRCPNIRLGTSGFREPED